MYYIYVLKSDVYDRIYIGSSENIGRRIREHNVGKTFSTKPYCPWRLIYQESFKEKSDALKRERQIKKSGVVRNALRREEYQGPIV